MHVAVFNLNDFYLCFLYFAVLTLISWGNTYLARERSVSTFYLRKIEHILLSVLFIPVVFNLLSWGWGMVVSFSIITTNLTSTLLKRKGGRKSIVVVLHLCAFAVLALLWLRHDFQVVIIPIMVLGVGDPAAALVGRKWGGKSPRIFSNGKTFVGMFSGLVAAVVVLALLPFDVPSYVKITPAFVMILESLMPGAYDNAFLLTAAGLIAFLLF